MPSSYVRSSGPRCAWHTPRDSGGAAFLEPLAAWKADLEDLVGDDTDDEVEDDEPVDDHDDELTGG